METNTDTAEKRTAIEYLTFGAKTTKRVTWESWEFTVIGPHLVRVTNASYGYLKDEHSYLVGIEDRNGVAVPAECECPADLHQPGDCKHKVALATVGGPIVLDAAVTFENLAPASSGSEPETVADKLRSDGGNPDRQEGDYECACISDFPCWACYRTGRRDVPE